MPNAPVDGRGYTIAELFSNRFQLDPYQREYTWSTGDVRRLLYDLQKRFMHSWSSEHARDRVGDYTPYFLGPYVFYQAGGTTFLVDGQQRVTTLHLLLIHLRRLLQEQGLEEEAHQIMGLISTVRFGDRKYTVDIEERQPILDALLNGQDFEVPEKANPSIRNLWARSTDVVEEFPPDLLGEALPYFCDWLLHRVGLVGIEAVDRGNGWEIFETMNDRGTRLSPVDLLKSFLLGKATASKAEQLNKVWREMLSTLTSVEGVVPADFVVTLLLARYADTRAESDDVRGIELSFHEWFRSNARKMGLVGDSNYGDFITKSLRPLSEGYALLRRAALSPQPGLEAVYYNEMNGIRDQYRLILAAVEPADQPSVFKQKARLVADWLDLTFVRRLFHGYAPQGSAMKQVVDAMVEPLRACRGVDQIRRRLALDIPDGDLFPEFDTYGLRGDNRRPVRYLLARMTAFAEAEVGERDQVDTYLDERQPFQIEHIWANHFSRYKDQVRTQENFDTIRNRLGGLLLLHGSDNASYRDRVYAEKLEHYQRQNVLAQCLHPTSHQNNPRMRRFMQRRELQTLMRPFPQDFDVEANQQRQKLYKRLCEIIWSPTRLGLLREGEVRETPPRERKPATRAHYGVEVAELVRADLLTAGAKLNPGKGKRPDGDQAVVLADGRIKVAGGQVFMSLSGAGAYVKNAKACPGWDYWHVDRGGKLVPLKTVRADYLKENRLRGSAET